ncbi:MAG: SIMPL domain-containing protein [Rhodobacteraceae bacterium]|nr:SIMPL domain-containing protein [Paracoccaceae bacterium]MBL6639928.1 SIMPL domain-containing protein [Paracoccaceae bacterium]MBL6677048.1 SIMPL domain-containing protein [Paracoccaceae bacterium]MBL6788960.1 SIMPL domain-containing protein [Paracoccaceae bacterium]MBL6859698.1 SIMPL domain-containing protein [Paracoccaceae bacterium]
MYFKHFICRNIIYLAVCLIFSSQLAFATQPVRMLTVTGVAVVKVKPDQAKLTWTIEARADAPASAMSALSSKTASILAALEAFGLPKEDLASSVLSLSPNF